AQIERGEIRLIDLTVIQRLAAVLGAPLQEFIEAALGPDTETVRNRPYVERLRLAIAGHPAPDSIITRVADGPTLRPGITATTHSARLAAYPRQRLPRHRASNRYSHQRVGKSQPHRCENSTPRTPFAACPDLSSRRGDAGQ